ncbi:MAG TPA: ion transporter [Gemmatimonadaceae bacterium]|nr:ion transporter [Gemmatimonadaceae bacterium]
MNAPPKPTDPESEPGETAARWSTLRELEEWLETPLRVLGFVWLVLLVVEFTRGLSRALTIATTIIWVIFILDFALRLLLAPARWTYLRRNWLTAVSLAVPALRVIRAVRAVRAVRALRAARMTRGMRLVRVVGSMNRGMQALGRLLERRGLGYVLALTALVTVLGAAGMYAFERELPDGQGLTSFSSALWWTAMIMTTMGTDYWPRTGEGRALCLLLALYAFAVFGYVTASLASFFIGQDAARDIKPDLT